jgi:NAD-dependent DNA ligase
MRVNVNSVFYVTRSFLPKLLAVRGSIINIASVAGLVGIKHRFAYCASKRAVVAMTRQLAVEYPDGNPDGHLFREIVVFTGQLSLPRAEMPDLASFAGCRVDDGVTKHTTLVVVGDQDVRRLNGATISAKHQKARDLIAKGKPLRVVSEADLMLLLAH